MSIISLLKKSSGVPLVHPTIFFLDFKNQEKNFGAEWLPASEIKTLEIAWQTSITWKDLNSDIVIATNLNFPGDTMAGPQDLNLNVTEEYHNISYLKSHLQKCIRRSNVNKAIKTACHMIKLDAQELLRRLAIITLEDVLPLNGFSTLIWLTVAISKGFVLSEIHYYWILGYIYDLCMCKHCEKQPQNKVDEKTSVDFKSLKLRSLCQNGRNVCYSIMLRQAYGGMKGDKELCLKLAELWSARFRVKSEFLNLLNRQLKFITYPVEPLFKDDWIVAAIDFHCYTGILLNIAEKHDQFTEDEIKQAIWKFSSSITNKLSISPAQSLTQDQHEKYFKIWNTIKKDFFSLGKFMINKNS
jgi:hypothetical protein